MSKGPWKYNTKKDFKKLEKRFTLVNLLGENMVPDDRNRKNQINQIVYSSYDFLKFFIDHLRIRKYRCDENEIVRNIKEFKLMVITYNQFEVPNKIFLENKNVWFKDEITDEIHIIVGWCRINYDVGIGNVISMLDMFIRGRNFGLLMIDLLFNEMTIDRRPLYIANPGTSVEYWDKIGVVDKMRMMYYRDIGFVSNESFKNFLVDPLGWDKNAIQDY